MLADDAPLAWSWLWVAAMVLVGGITVARRVPNVPGLLGLTCGALAVAVTASLVVVFGFDIFPLEPRTVVPTAGMILGNAIGAHGAAPRRTLRCAELDQHRDHIEARLSLGKSRRSARPCAPTSARRSAPR